MGRYLLPAIGGVLALLVLLTHVQGQTKPAGASDAAQKPKVRILAVSTPPLADERLPEGGLILALANASLSRAEPGIGSERAVRWAKEALTPELLADRSIDLSLPVEGADCDHPNNLTQASAALCDASVFSDPILQVVLGLFTLSNSSFKFDTDDSILGKTICLSRQHDLSALNGSGRNWAAHKRVSVMQRAALIDCVAAVQAHEADTFVATDLEGAYLLRRLGLTAFFSMQARPLATVAVHAVVRRDHARRAELINALNQGLKRLKEGEAYSAIVQKHLIAAATAPLASSRGREVPSLGPGAAKAAVPAIDPANRERALRYLKRADEELAEGRVAPARLLYERAADIGLAQAAMALAATYDAAELDKPLLHNVLPDAVQAKRWYERARALGAADAGARLRRLGAK